MADTKPIGYWKWLWQNLSNAKHIIQFITHPIIETFVCASLFTTSIVIPISTSKYYLFLLVIVPLLIFAHILYQARILDRTI